MRVTKNTKGQFVIEDEPMRVEGKAARTLLAEMRTSDGTADDAERKRFLAECEQIYRTAKRG